MQKERHLDLHCEAILEEYRSNRADFDRKAAEIYGREWMPFSIQGLAWIQMALMLFYLLYYHKKVLDAAK